jgi:hypothetical protein
LWFSKHQAIRINDEPAQVCFLQKSSPARARKHIPEARNPPDQAPKCRSVNVASYLEPARGPLRAMIEEVATNRGSLADA